MGSRVSGFESSPKQETCELRCVRSVLKWPGGLQLAASWFEGCGPFRIPEVGIVHLLGLALVPESNIRGMWYENISNY